MKTTTATFEKDLVPIYVASLRYYLAAKHGIVGSFRTEVDRERGMIWIGFNIKSDYSDELC